MDLWVSYASILMLSGAVLALKPIPRYDDLVRLKIKRLLIPFYIYGWCFMLPVKTIGDFYDKAGLKAALKGFLSGQGSGHLWFLIALFWCILFFGATVKILKKI